MTLTLPDGDFAAYLFDCDGTIADSMPLHYIAWSRALNEYGCISFTEELLYAWGGMPVEAFVAELNRCDGLSIIHPLPKAIIPSAKNTKRGEPVNSQYDTRIINH